MMGHPDKPWRDFKFTVDVIVAATLAREDWRAKSSAQEASFRFNLLAASDITTPRFPEAGWRDTRQLLSALVAEGAGELRISLQAVGYAAMARFAGRAARMLSQDGEIDVAFRFDSQGHGIVVLADNPEIRRAIANIDVELG